MDNLLTLSRTDSGQTVLTLERLDLSDLALEEVERLAPLAARRGVTLVAGTLPELTVLGDRTFLSRPDRQSDRKRHQVFSRGGPRGGQN